MKLYPLLPAARPQTLTGFFSLLIFLGLSLANVTAQNTISTVAGGGAAGGSANAQIATKASAKGKPAALLGSIVLEHSNFLDHTRFGAPVVAKPVVRPMIGIKTYADIPGPSAVVTDGLGDTYIASPDSQYVYKLDQSNTLTVFAGIGYSTEDALKYDGGAATSASLNEPTGLALDNSGNVFIADMTNYLIRRVDANGIIHTIAGNTHLCNDPTTLCGDGKIATAAQMSYPTGVATDATGNVYIADTQDNRVRVVNMQSVAITIAGVRIGPGAINTIAGTGNACASGTNACGDGGSAKAATCTSGVQYLVLKLPAFW